MSRGQWGIITLGGAPPPIDKLWLINMGSTLACNHAKGKLAFQQNMRLGWNDGVQIPRARATAAHELSTNLARPNLKRKPSLLGHKGNLSCAQATSIYIPLHNTNKNIYNTYYIYYMYSISHGWVGEIYIDQKVSARHAKVLKSSCCEITPRSPLEQAPARQQALLPDSAG